MNRTFRLLCGLILVLAAFFAQLGVRGIFPAYATEYIPEPVTIYDCGDYSYRLESNGTAVITDYHGEAEEIVLPTELDGYPVSAVGDNAFAYYDMTRLEIPKGIGRITGRAFQYCTVTDSFSLPRDIVLEIRAFEYAFLPDFVTIPKGAVIGGDCFSYCEGMKALFVEPQAAVKGSAFNYSKDLKAVVCASGATLADRSFYSCDRLREVILCGKAALEGKPFQYCGLAEITYAEKEDYAPYAQSAREKALEPAVKPGTAENGRYCNASLDLACALPDDWTAVSPEKLAARMGLPADSFEKTDSLALYLQDHAVWTDMLAGTDDGDQLSVLVFPVPEALKEPLSIIDLEELAPALAYSAAGMLAAQGCTGIDFVPDDDFADFLSDEAVCLSFSAAERGIPLFVRELFFPVDAEDYMVAVTACSYGEDRNVEYLKFFA